MRAQGTLIVVEGIDGAGKTTQTKLIQAWASKTFQRNVVTFDFPAYDRSPFGKMIGQFLRGDYGDPVAMDPFQTALLYAGDRHYAKSDLCAALARGDIVVLNRYVPSNLAYGCAKLRLLGRAHERDKLVAFTELLEYEMLCLPRPDAVIFLATEPSTAARQIDVRCKETATESRDQYEENSALQEIVAEEYARLAARKEWHSIAVNNRTIEDVHCEVQAIVRQTASNLNLSC